MSSDQPSNEMLENLDLLLEMDVLEEEENWDIAEEDSAEEHGTAEGES